VIVENFQNLVLDSVKDSFKKQCNHEIIYGAGYNAFKGLQVQDVVYGISNNGKFSEFSFGVGEGYFRDNLKNSMRE